MAGRYSKFRTAEFRRLPNLMVSGPHSRRNCVISSMRPCRVLVACVRRSGAASRRLGGARPIASFAPASTPPVHRARMLARWIAAALIVRDGVPRRSGAFTIDELPAESVYTVARIRIEGTGDVSPSALRAVMLTRLPPWYLPWRRWLASDRSSTRTCLPRRPAAHRRCCCESPGTTRRRCTHELVVARRRASRSSIDDRRGTAREGRIASISSRRLRAELGRRRRAARRDPAAPGGAVHADRLRRQPRSCSSSISRDAASRMRRSRRPPSSIPATDEAAVRYRVTRGIPAVFGIDVRQGTDQVAVRLVRREIAFRPGDAFDPREARRDASSHLRAPPLPFGHRPSRRTSRTAAAPSTSPSSVVEGPPRELIAGIGYGLEDEVRGQLPLAAQRLLRRWPPARRSAEGLGDRAVRRGRVPPAVLSASRSRRSSRRSRSSATTSRLHRRAHPLRTAGRAEAAAAAARGGRVQRRVRRLEQRPRRDRRSSRGRARRVTQPRGIVSSLTAFVERSTTTDLLDPREGSVVNLTLEQAGGPWQGAYSFYTAVVDAKKYFPLAGERTLAGAAQARYRRRFRPEPRLPLFRRFFAGGINSTRGYDRHLLGPLNDERRTGRRPQPARGQRRVPHARSTARSAASCSSTSARCVASPRA